MKKRILITAKNSYIGNSFAEWVANREEYIIDFISCRTDDWKNTSFSGYDVILHVAGIAHIKETRKNADLYYTVNRDLTIKLAKKAKLNGVKQFIFLSTMSVYGIENGLIRIDTQTNPKSNYGLSKLQAEEQIKLMEDSYFKIAIIRPPMVYGKGCKGNYQKLSKFALITPVFPNVHNQRSMIYIDNLSEFIKRIIDEQKSGIFLPQNAEYVNVVEMIRIISEINGRQVRFINCLNPIVKFMKRYTKTINKIFGNLIYEKGTTDYCVVDFEESIRLTEA